MLQPFKIYRSFFITALVFLVISFVVGRETIDLHLHDTYFVIAHAQLYACFAAFLVLVGLACVAANRLLYSLRLSKLHISLTLFTTLALAILLQVQPYLMKDVSSSGFNLSAMRWLDRVGLMIVLLFLLMLASQLLLITNILLGLFKKIHISKKS